MEKIIIHTDGGSRGNPGPSGIGLIHLYFSSWVELGIVFIRPQITRKVQKVCAHYPKLLTKN